MQCTSVAMVADDKAPPELMSALVTEHFVLQSAASATISESGSRVTIYLSSLSSGLVAMGFASSSRHALAALAFTVLPTVFVLGCFTIVRLIDTSVANVISLRRMERIRRYYASITPWGASYFEADDSVAGDHGVRYSRWSFLFTMASMVTLVNAVLGGATITLACSLGGELSLVAAVPLGIAAGLLMLGAGLLYQHRRLTPVVVGAAPPAGSGETAAAG
jgi:hypothetical protein